MNTYLLLFLTFLKIGAFSFGGGYGMIAVIRDSCLSLGWLTEEELMNFIAVSESTPGPIAINMATFVGASQGGILGAFLATLGVVLPSFCIILLIASIMTHLLKLAGVKAALDGVRPVVTGLIVATGLTMILSILFGFSQLSSPVSPDLKAIGIFIVITAIGEFVKLKLKKSISPILLIAISAVLGVLLYSF